MQFKCFRFIQINVILSVKLYVVPGERTQLHPLPRLAKWAQKWRVLHWFVAFFLPCAWTEFMPFDRVVLLDSFIVHVDFHRPLYFCSTSFAFDMVGNVRSFVSSVLDVLVLSTRPFFSLHHFHFLFFGCAKLAAVCFFSRLLYMRSRRAVQMHVANTVFRLMLACYLRLSTEWPLSYSMHIFHFSDDSTTPG